MARPSLTFELRSTVNKARKANQPVRKTGLEVKLKNQTHQIAIEAIPIKTGSDEKLTLIVFEETFPPLVSATDAADARNRRIRQLEDELATLREDMRSIIEEQEASTEELQSANEEIISSNEELQSINEELETSKEEIESTNEELLTINQELQVRNDQLSDANEFSDVIFSTIREATLVLDEDLRVRSANQTFYKLFRLREEEIEGRLIYELGGGQWDVPQLRMLLTNVIARDTSIEGYEISYTFPDIGDKVLLLNARRVIRDQEAILLAIEDITDHRQAQQFVEEREAWLHALIDNAPVLIWVSGSDGQYTFFNKAWLDYTGCTLEEAIREDWNKNIHPDDQESYEANYQDAFKQHKPFQAEYRLKRSDGEYRWMLVNAKPAFSAQGAFNGYIGTCAEIYNRKTITQLMDVRALQRTQRIIEIYAEMERIQREMGQAGLDVKQQHLVQQRLWDTEEQLRTLIDTTPDVITRWDTSLKLIFANSAFEIKTGMSNESLLGKTNQEMGQPAEIAVPYMNKLRHVIKTGLPQSHYNSFPTPGGLAYFYSSMFPELGPDGLVKSVLAISRDISDLKLVEEIQQTAKSLQAVLDSSPTAIGLFKAIRNEQSQVVDFQIVVCNEKFADMLGQPMDELPGQLVRQLGSTLWAENTFNELRQVLTTGEPTYREEGKDSLDDDQNPADSQRTDGPTRWLGMSLTRHDEGVVLTALDITALKQAEQQRAYWLNQLDQSQATLQALDQMRQQVRERGEFLRTTTHDLRGSFGVIQGATSLLQMMDTEEERAQMLAMLQRNLVQVTELLTQLMDYSRLEAGQEVVDVVDFDASDLLHHLSESMQPLADERRLTITTDGPGQLPVSGDSVKVQRIAQNLILNALKYTQDGGVTVSWQADGAGWVLDVADTGPGLPTVLTRQLMGDSTPQAPEPTTPPTTGKNEASGEGIGLFIVKRLVVLLGARLLVESEAGVGTRFEIQFP
jgi:two-component system CheB/CheR fusion protein